MGISIDSRLFALEKLAQQATRWHVVGENDTLHGVARKNNTTVPRILRYNPALVSNPNRLRIGQRIALPPANAAATAPRPVVQSRVAPRKPVKAKAVAARAASATVAPAASKSREEALRMANFQSPHSKPYPSGNRTVNNPGGLRPPRKNPLWLGELNYPGRKPDVGFARFDTPQHGLRAVASNLRNIKPMSYAELHDEYSLIPEKDLWRLSTSPAFSTLNNVIPRYAPKFENDTKGYIANASRVSGIDPDARLDFDDDAQMVNLLKGIVHSESGKDTMNWFTPEEYLNAVRSSRQNL